MLDCRYPYSLSLTTLRCFLTLVARTRLICLVAVLCVTTGVSRAAGGAESLTVYAAASLTDAMQEVTHAFTIATGTPVRLSFASSAILARQIEAGAGADLFVSADQEWMDYLERRQLVRKASRRDLLGNRLVLIAPAGNVADISLADVASFRAALGGGRLALGDPQTVPVGRYARAALQSVGVWGVVEQRLVYADNVRSALAFVARGEAPLGVVYATDARIEKRVVVLAEFPPSSHQPITYPVALTKDASPTAARLLQFLQQPEAQAIFQHYGFVPINPVGKGGASSGAARDNTAQARHRLDEMVGSPVVLPN